MDCLEKYMFLADEYTGSLRLDVFICDELEGYSRNAVQRLIESGNVAVNERSQKSNYIVKPGDKVSVVVPMPEELKITAENIQLDIIYEDSQLLIVNKPQGMVVHPSYGHYSGTLVNALLFHCKNELSGINGVLRPGIVHRIDKDTSGILVIAKTDSAHKSLSEQLSAHTITRKYNAIVYNNLKDHSGTIDKPIGRHQRDRKKMAIADKNGKNAVTHYRVLERLGKYTFIETSLETGRTHQIRVHMASIGHPLLGDNVYGAKKCPFNLNGQMLHAKVLGFVHPKTNEYIEFDSRLPDYFIRTLELLRKQGG